MARFGKIWEGMIKQDLARYGKEEKARFGMIWQLKGKSWQDLARYDKVRSGKIRQDMTR